MAFGTTGWRRIVIMDQVYYWQTTDGSADLFHVRPEREPHRLLRVRSSQCGHRGGFLGRVTPGMVRGGVEGAIEGAWLGDRPNTRLIVFSNPLRYVGIHPCWLTSSTIALAEAVCSET